jgi:hypothetical protein
VLRWRPANGEDIPTPNINEIVVLSSFFQHGFGFPTCEFLCGLLHHYEIKLFIPPFTGRLLEFSDTWSDEPTPAELPIVAALGNRVNDPKNQGLTNVGVAAHWLAHQVMPLKKPVNPRWEYNAPTILESTRTR